MKDYKSVIRRPLITEKLTAQREAYNRYGFEVDKRANKHDIKRAVEAAFKVTVVDVATINMRGKVKRYGRTQGPRPDWKKAIVTVAKDKKIELIEGV